MAKVWPKRLLVLALALAIAACVGAAASAGRSGAGQRGYARVLRAVAASAAAAPVAAADPVGDCLMAATLMRRENGLDAAIDPARFEALRAFCRANAAHAAESAPEVSKPSL